MKRIEEGDRVTACGPFGETLLRGTVIDFDGDYARVLWDGAYSPTTTRIDRLDPDDGGDR